MTTLLPLRFGASRARVWLHAAWLLTLILALPFAFAQSGAPSLADAQAAVDAAPSNPNAWVALGDGELAMGTAEGAKSAYLEAIALDYRLCDAHYGLGLAEFALTDLEAARFAFEEVARLCPTRFDGHYNRAVTLARLQQPEEAATAFERALEEAEPEADTDDRVAALTGLAGQRARVEAFDAAADAYERARALRPSDADLVYLHGEALWRAGRGLEALPDLTMLETQVADARVSILIAEIYLAAEQTDYALRTLERAIARAREAGEAAREADVQLRLGALLRGLGRNAEAADALRAASKLDPDSYETMYTLGMSLLDAGDFVAAKDALIDAQVLAGDDDAVATLALAEAYDLLEQPIDALREAQRVLAGTTGGATGDVAALRADALLLAGRSAYRIGTYDEASTYLEQAQRERPNDASVHVWAGLAAYQRSSYEEAARAFEQALTLDPDDRAARRNLGAAYLASDRFADAAEVYVLLVEQEPADTQSAYNLGWAYVGLQDRVSARDVWASACELGYRAACDALAEMF